MIDTALRRFVVLSIGGIPLAYAHMVQPSTPSCPPNYKFATSVSRFAAFAARRSLCTASAAREPSSIAPSMKLRQPTAQSEFAKKTLPWRARRSSRLLVMKPAEGKNLSTCQ
jgi:hypothetical protein